MGTERRRRPGGAAAWALLLLAGCAPLRRSTPPVVDGVQTGIASWYGPGFHGRATANGEVFDQNELTAAHPTLPLGSRAIVTNLENQRAVEVRINDRGPFRRGRVIDLSHAAARSLGMIGPGTVRVRIEVVGRARAAPAPERPDEGAYAVEVAALRDVDRARHLRDVLAQRFPDAFVHALPEPAGRCFRVRVGPYAARALALRHAERLGRLGYPAVIVEEPSR